MVLRGICIRRSRDDVVEHTVEIWMHSKQLRCVEGKDGLAWSRSTESREQQIWSITTLDVTC